MDLATGDLVCEKCKLRCVIRVNMVGVIFRIASTHYLMCPDCCEIKMWHAYGNELTSCHCNKVLKARPLHQCDVCGAKSVVAALDPMPDFKTKTFVSLILCGKHRPPVRILKNIQEMSQFRRYIDEKGAN